MSQTVLVISGTGVQGAAVVKALVEAGGFEIKILTRSATSPEAIALAAIPGVSIIEGNCYDETDLNNAYKGIDATYVNTNSGILGEMSEIYWGIRIFQIASIHGVKHFVWAGLDYIPKLEGYNNDPNLRVKHYEGKGKVNQFIESQPTSPMAWTILNSGPYMDMLNTALGPSIDNDGTRVFKIPLGPNGAMPMIILEDLGRYAAWILQNPAKSNGLAFGASTQHVHWPELVKTFTEVTGKPAKYLQVPASEWVEKRFAHLPNGASTKFGTAAHEDDPSVWTWGQNFINWFNLYEISGSNTGLIKRDYKFLDEILPERTKSVGEWMKKTGYTGEPK